MKKLGKISILILTFFTLLGCPASHFYRYIPIDEYQKKLKDYYEFKISSNSVIDVETGLLQYFVEKKKILFANIMIAGELSGKDLTLEVYSKKCGKLNRRQDTNNFIGFYKELSYSTNHIKLLKDDTLTIYVSSPKENREIKFISNLK